MFTVMEIKQISIWKDAQQDELKRGKEQTPEGGGGGGGVARFLKPSLFITKTCDFPYLIHLTPKLPPF